MREWVQFVSWSRYWSSPKIVSDTSTPTSANAIESDPTSSTAFQIESDPTSVVRFKWKWEENSIWAWGFKTVAADTKNVAPPYEMQESTQKSLIKKENMFFKFLQKPILMFQLQIVLFDLVKIYEDELWMRRSKFGQTDCFDSGSQSYEKKLSLSTTKLVLYSLAIR